MSLGICTIQGCSSNRYVGWWCKRHYRDRRIAQIFSLIVPSENGCLEWSGHLDRHGYGRIGYEKKQWMAHRLIWLIENRELPSELDVLHRCDNPKCVNVRHLFLGTQLDNLRDCKLKGRTTIGERHGAAKLSAYKVGIIRSLSKSLTQTDIARIFNVHQTTISDVINGIRWSHIKEVPCE